MISNSSSFFARLFLAIFVLVSLTGSATAQGAPPNGVYNGVYLCAQGTANLKVSLQMTAGGEVSGVVTLYPSGTQKPGYTYSLHGQYDARTEKFALQPLRWETEHPANLTMMGINGTVEDNELRGTISGAAGCTAVRGERDPAESTRIAAVIASQKAGTPSSSASSASRSTPPAAAPAAPSRAPSAAANATVAPANTQKANTVDLNKIVQDLEQADKNLAKAETKTSDPLLHWSLESRKDALTDEVSSELTARTLLPGLNHRVTVTAACFRNGVRMLFQVNRVAGGNETMFEWYIDPNATGPDNQVVDVRIRVDAGTVHVAKAYPESRNNVLYGNWMGFVFYDPGLRDRIRQDQEIGVTTGISAFDRLLGPMVRTAAESNAQEVVNSSAGPISQLMDAKSIRVELPLSGFNPRPIVDLNPQDKAIHQYVSECNAQFQPKAPATPTAAPNGQQPNPSRSRAPAPTPARTR